MLLLSRLVSIDDQQHPPNLHLQKSNRLITLHHHPSYYSTMVSIRLSVVALYICTIVERPYFNPYAACDCRAATETMERGMKLVVDVPDQVRRRGLSSSPWKGGVVVVGCCAQLSDFDSFPTFRFVSAGSTGRTETNERKNFEGKDEYRKRVYI